MQVGSAVGAHDFLVGKFNCDNLIQKDILMPIGVTLRIKRFCNHVSGKLGLVTIVKIDNVRSGV